MTRRKFEVFKNIHFVPNGGGHGGGGTCAPVVSKPSRDASREFHGAPERGNFFRRRRCQEFFELFEKIRLFFKVIMPIS